MSGTVVGGGQVVSNVVVVPGSPLVVNSGGTASNTTVSSGGTVSDLTGGTLGGGTVNSGGAVYVNGGAADNLTVAAGGSVVVYSGSVSGMVLDGDSNGRVYPYPTGTNGALQVLGSNSIAYDTQVNAGGWEMVSAGGTLSGSEVETYGYEFVSNGGTAIGTTVFSAGSQSVAGTAYNTVIYAGGTQRVGGTAYYDTVYGNATGANIISATVMGGGQLWVTSATAAILEAGSEMFIQGGTDSGTVLSGGILKTDLSGTDTNVTVLSGGVLIEEATANGVVISSGGVMILSGGGAASNVQMYTGGGVETSIGYSAAETATITAGNVLELLLGSNVLFSQALTGNYNGATVSVEDYFNSNLIVNVGNAAELVVSLCFYPGTRIATPDGEVAVENLRAGEMVLTAKGPQPVRWIGHSHVHMGFADPLRALPIRISAGALGAGLPVRDLLLSPDHALYLDGVLVQASALVGQPGIRRETAVPEQFTYYHVELASHELLFAEGALAESFVDNVERMHFHNWSDRAAPVEPIAEMDLPRVKSARQLPLRLHRALAA
jgi:autotransporter passenger strand-loop-strand repeat protein